MRDTSIAPSTPIGSWGRNSTCNAMYMYVSVHAMFQPGGCSVLSQTSSTLLHSKLNPLFHLFSLLPSSRLAHTQPYQFFRYRLSASLGRCLQVPYPAFNITASGALERRLLAFCPGAHRLLFNQAICNEVKRGK